MQQKSRVETKIRFFFSPAAYPPNCFSQVVMTEPSTEPTPLDWGAGTIPLCHFDLPIQCLISEDFCQAPMTLPIAWVGGVGGSNLGQTQVELSGLNWVFHKLGPKGSVWVHTQIA